MESKTPENSKRTESSYINITTYCGHEWLVAVEGVADSGLGPCSDYSAGLGFFGLADVYRVGLACTVVDLAGAAFRGRDWGAA